MRKGSVSLSHCFTVHVEVRDSAHCCRTGVHSKMERRERKKIRWKKGEERKLEES